MTAHHALLFGQLSADVTILAHTGPPLDEEAHDLPVVDGKVVALEVSDDALTGVRLADGTVVACQALVVRPRFVAHSPVLEALGLEATESPDGDRSYATGPGGSTEIPGVWAAGNVTDPMAWVMAAAAAGTMTGAALNLELIQSA
jgi:thioredoxin reductase